MKKIFFFILVFLVLISVAGCSTCRPEGTSCCKGTVAKQCATASVAMCDDGSTPEFKGCSKDCVPVWECQNQANNFEECVAAGNPVMESYPRQCRSGGRTFTEVI